jgi:hypothetical protein
MLGKSTDRVAARVATEIVLREIAKLPAPKEETRRRSWCCHARVIPVQGQLVMPETFDVKHRWMMVIVLLCDTCGKQLHGREYEGWLGDA